MREKNIRRETADKADETATVTEAAKTADTAPAAETETAPKKRRPSLLKNKKFRMGSAATALTVVFIAAVVLLNVIAGILNNRYPLKLDLTDKGMYTLSENSEKVAKGIKSPVQIVVFGKESSYRDADNVVFKQVYEFTKLYASLSGGNITVRYVDATQSPAEYAKYSSYGVSDGSILFLNGEGRSVVTAPEDLYQYDQEQYYYYQNFQITESYVEKVLATNVQAVTRENTTKVVLLTGHKEQEYTQSGIQSLLKRNGYGDCETVDITTATAIPEDANVAVIPAPSEDYTDSELTRLSQWLSHDGKLDRHLVVLPDYTASCPKLFELLAEEYGIRVCDYLVASTNFNNLFSTQNGFFTYANVLETDYTKDLAADSARIKVPFSRGLEALWTEDSDKSSSFATILASFPKDGSQLAQLSDLDSETESGVKTEEAKADVPAAVMSTHYIYDSDTNQSHETHVLVIGSMLAVSESYLSNIANNESLFMGVFNGINKNADALTVDALSLSTQTFEIGALPATLLGLLFSLILPIVLLIAGLVVFLRRRHL